MRPESFLPLAAALGMLGGYPLEGEQATHTRQIPPEPRYPAEPDPDPPLFTAPPATRSPRLTPDGARKLAAAQAKRERRAAKLRERGL